MFQGRDIACERGERRIFTGLNFVITPGQALEEKTRVRLAEPDAARFDLAALPLRLQDLMMRTRRLHARIMHLDALVADERPTPVPRESPVALQRDLLLSAFGTPH